MPIVRLPCVGRSRRPLAPPRHRSVRHLPPVLCPSTRTVPSRSRRSREKRRSRLRLPNVGQPLRRLAAATMALALAACSNVESGTPGDTLTNPPEIRSHDGVLDGTLAIEPATAIVAGEEVRFDALYDGLYMPPILRVNPGDVVRLGIDNRSTRSINTHYHGLNVSPQPGSDDVFLDIGFGESYRYDMQIPANHSAGLFWYHPHWHPFTNKDIAGGLSGGLVVGDILAPFPELRGIPEQFMLLKDLKQTIDGRPEPFPAPAGPGARSTATTSRTSRCAPGRSSSGASARSARTSTTGSAWADSASTSSPRTATSRTRRSRPRTSCSSRASVWKSWCMDRRPAATTSSPSLSTRARRAMRTPANCSVPWSRAATRSPRFRSRRASRSCATCAETRSRARAT